jgi:hypothetical protein
MKRILALVLSFLFTAGILPTDTFASGGSFKHYEECTSIPEFYSATNQEAVEYWNTIKNLLPSGTKSSVNGYPLNFRLWHDKQLVVYGNYSSVNNGARDWKKGTQPSGTGQANLNEGYYYNGERGEYRYHGFDSMGNKFTNINFINDADLGINLTDKDWMIMPWNSQLIKPRVSESDYNKSAIEFNNPTTQQWINRSADFKIQGSSENAYKYMHVLSPPTLMYPGQGRMWHIHNSTVWYQSFPVPKLDATVKEPINPTDIEVALTVNNDPSELSFIDYGTEFDNNIINVSVTVTATLMDEAYINDPVLKVNHYTRDDLKEWTLCLNDQTKTVRLWSRNSGKADFVIPLTKSQIKSLQGHKYPLAARGQAIFLDDSQSPHSSKNGQVLFSINGEPVVPDPEPETEPEEPENPEEPLPPFEPQPDIPGTAFDIIEFEASDSTSSEISSSRSVYIDGGEVDDNTFFAGSYIFGEENIGLKKVTVNYTSIYGQEAQVEKWVMVYSTKPVSQFKLEGTFKENRKLTASNTSSSANSTVVTSKYPITSYNWSYSTVEGSGNSMKIRQGETDLFKELMYKEPGVYRITLTATNSLGRTSEPYILQFVIFEDLPPAIEICLDNSVLGRNDTIGAYHYMVSSTDGDLIDYNTIELWYDSNNDGTFDRLVNTYDGSDGFPVFVPDDTSI